MSYLKNLLVKLLLAACVMGGAGQAGAAPMYHVAIDTSTLGGGSAYLGLYFLGLADAAPATATVGALAGAFSGAPQVSGAVSGAPFGPLVFSNAGGGAEWVASLGLGGMLSFDVGFTLGGGDAGTTFGWALFDDSRYLGADGDLGTLSLQPGADVVVNNLSGLSQVTAVPEPSAVLMMFAGGLFVLVRVRGRRADRGRAFAG
nr:NF038129 family PEP-CTERM protein [uncultured Duganella sp.]